MNIKAERIEQLVQLVNRNLQLICAGQAEGLTPLESSRLQKVDAVIFGHDKFAYEMVHFVAAAVDKDPQRQNSMDLFTQWEDNFVRGLESLLVECAVIHDDIERDCFVSRVYCWFSEKLLERREVPRAEMSKTLELRQSVVQFAGEDAHMARALDNYSGGPLSPHRAYIQNSTADVDVLDAGADTHVRLPPIPNTTGHTPIASRLPLYVKHAQPAILRSQSLARVIAPAPVLPRVPGAQENYGLLYSQPETDAERNMNELWLARRRQEAFQYKTQQQLAVVMDRLALHKSRMESDALRRTEVAEALRSSNGSGRPTSGAMTRPQSAGAIPSRPQSHSASGQRGITARMRPAERRPRDDSPGSSPERDAAADTGPSTGATGASGTHGHGSSLSVLMSGGEAAEREVQVVTAARSSFLKSDGSRKETVPMRFKTSLPAGFSADRQRFYLREAEDSDDEGDPVAPRSTKPTTAGGKKKGGAGAGAGRTEVFFKHDKPALRERPLSARLFRQIAQDDPEFKVFYRSGNYRRMELTTEQEKWLEERHAERKALSDETARKLVADVQARADKKKNKDKEGKAKDKDKEGKSKDKGKDKGAGKGGKAGAEPEAVKPKYKSASQFMSRHFPQFEEKAEAADGTGLAPMRQLQLEEVADVVEACRRFRVPIRETVLRKALVVPQDKPEAMCLECMRDGPEGLMTNPLPPHLWRKFAAAKKGKKKKGKK